LTAEEKFDYWLDHATYDLETAEAMCASGRWAYVVFMCQQAIEKLVKGLYLLYVDDVIPRLHNIEAIFMRFADQVPEPLSDERRLLFEQLARYYLETRYTEYKEKISRITTGETARALLAQTKEAFQWLLTLKPSTAA
jgi:HEPN domain-containing protein